MAQTLSDLPRCRTGPVIYHVRKYDDPPMASRRTASNPQTEGLDLSFPEAPASPVRLERAFNISIIVSAIRCTIAYVILPFVTPFIGLAPGVGPVLGIAIGVVAIAANVFSLRRFWKARHRWRKPITVLHVSVIGLLAVLMVLDFRDLLAG